VGKGFPWAEVVQAVKFTEELLKETKGKWTWVGVGEAGVTQES
jgi:hypothetical protein